MTAAPTTEPTWTVANPEEPLGDRAIEAISRLLVAADEADADPPEPRPEKPP